MPTVRSSELALSRARVNRALAGDGGTLWITGDAGIGKSVLLAELVGGVDPEWSIVRLSGAVHESKMLWSGISQLVHRLRSHLDALKPAHRAIIESIVDPTSGETPDAFAAAVSVHALVLLAAEARPLIIAVEDHHWLDPDSTRVLDFVGRRLDGLRALVIATSRSVVPSGDQIALDLLSSDEAVEMLVDVGLTFVVAYQLVGLIGGHPFALAHAARTLTAGQRSGSEPLPSPFPMSADELPAALATSINALPALTSKALHLLAAADTLGRGWRMVLERARIPLDSLAPAEATGVIAIGADSLRFTHPLFRSAVYAHATPAQRRASHHLLAEIETDPERALWHESRAIIGPDNDVAARLSAMAEHAYATGAYAGAFEAWTRAGELASRAEDAHVSEILAAEAALRAGNNAPARAIIDRSPPVESSDAALVRLAASFESRSGHVDEAYVLLVRAGGLLADEQPDHAANAYLDAARAALRVGQIHLAIAALDRLDEFSAQVRAESALQMAALVRALLDTTTGRSVAAFVEAVRTLVPTSGPLTGDLSFLADTVALGLAFQRRIPEALDLVERLRSAAVEQNQPSIIPFLDTAKACALSTIDLPGGMIAAANAVEWADAIGQPNLATGALSYLGNMQAALGDPGALATAERIEGADTMHGRLSSHVIRGFYWTTLGQPERVLEALLPLHEWSAGELKTVLFWQADLGEAAARTGRLELAREVADQLHAFGEVFPNDWLRGAAARIEGLIADIDDCGSWFAVSTAAFADAQNRMAEARSSLIWGERLRRARRRSEARQHLFRARALFEQLGAGRWIERCEQELVAAGGAAPPGDHSRDAERVLTPQELQIARLSVAGHSVRDIGTMMFVSARTVETHLSSVYRKLAVKNRAGLAASAATDPALRGTAS